MHIKHYWRIAPTLCPTFEADKMGSAFAVPAAIATRFKAGQALLIGRWHEEEEVGHVSALGVCDQLQGTQALVHWRACDIKLRPSSAGMRHWRTKACFGFARDVVDRYALADLFAEHFPEREADSFGNAANSAGPPRSGMTPQVATPGYVYLLKSPYGYKIGKTVNVKSRTRLFEVKLPFKFSLEHYAHFEDYSSAEQQLHRQFAAKRLEGEWFDLSHADVETIRRLGRPALSAPV